MWIKIQFPGKKGEKKWKIGKKIGKNKKSEKLKKAEKIEQEWKIKKKKQKKIQSKKFARSKNSCKVHNVNKELNKSWILAAAVSVLFLKMTLMFKWIRICFLNT